MLNRYILELIPEECSEHYFGNFGGYMAINDDEESEDTHLFEAEFIKNGERQVRGDEG